MFSGIVQRLYQFFATDGPDTGQQESLEELALRRCSVTLRKKLNLNEIIPHLNERNLLTESDMFDLRSKSPPEGVDYLVSILPKKKEGWWGELIASLKQSSSGTAHGDLVNLLETELQKLAISGAEQASNTEGDKKAFDDEYGQLVPKRPNRADLKDAMSGITLAICVLVEDMFSSKSKSKLAIKDHSAHHSSASTMLKNELEEVKYKHKVIVNQAKLINLHEHLIEMSEKFSAALGRVLQLYVDHYQKKASDKATKNKIDSEMIRILETATECTPNIDMIKERNSWKQCLDSMHKQLLILKKKLNTLNTDEMVKLQESWSLSGDAEKRAREWIEERRKVIDAGKSCLIELEEICKGDSVSDITKNACRAIQNRLEVGESCLEAWVSLIDHRTDLHGRGGSKTFDKFPKIMGTHGDDDAQHLATEMLKAIEKLHTAISSNTGM